jgi:hypothetical protein
MPHLEAEKPDRPSEGMSHDDVNFNGLTTD